MIVVSDTTPLITLLKVKHIDLLQTYFGNIQIPKAVFVELTCDERFAEEADELRNCSFIQVVEVSSSKSVDLLRRATGLDLGESEAIVLSDEIQADLLLMDEAHGRDVAERIGLKVMGTIGLLIASYQSGMIRADEIKECVNIIRKTGRHIGERYLRMLLDKIDEN